MSVLILSPYCDENDDECAPFAWLAWQCTIGAVAESLVCCSIDVSQPDAVNPGTVFVEAVVDEDEEEDVVVGRALDVVVAANASSNSWGSQKAPQNSNKLSSICKSFSSQKKAISSCRCNMYSKGWW